ncbi:MAG: MFS transporter, partial [Tepidiformaceae bacterium]
MEPMTAMEAGRTARRPPRLHALGRWQILAILTALYGIGTFGLLGISPLSPFILKEFGLTRGQIGLLVPALYVGALLFCIPAGRLADRFKPSVCLSSGLGFGGLMLSVAAAAPTFPALLGFLILAGLGW